jgi:hypothetical protein
METIKNTFVTQFAPDPVLPQRDILLDARQVATRLSAQLFPGRPITFDRCELVRVKYRLGESLRVVYRLRIQGVEYGVAARTFTEGRSAEVYRHALASPVAGSLLPSVHFDREFDTVWWTFPNDRKLTALPALFSVPRELAQQLPAWVTSRTVAYAPEKSATAQCLSAAGTVLAYVKVYTDDEGAHCASMHQALSASLPTDDPHLQLSRPIFYSAPYQMLGIEPVNGQRIADLDEQALRPALVRLGTAVGKLHTLPPPPDAPQFQRLARGRLHTAAGIIGQARPDVRDSITALVDTLHQQWRQPTESPVCLHGDVHAKNGMLQGHRVALIDLDQVSTGPATAELGSFFAGLRYWRRVGLFSHTVERDLRTAFLAGYASIRPLPDPGSIRWHTAAALLTERALRAVNRVRPQGLLHLSGIVADAHALLSDHDSN